MSLTTGYEAETLPGNDKGTGKYKYVHIAMPNRDRMKTEWLLFAADKNYIQYFFDLKACNCTTGCRTFRCRCKRFNL